ncbi:nuclear transport factor 2 family protein [Sphingomonas sp. QA11]|uniref:nuclear transport factor 2 family protein n=1 Tax=Sphingomonas sp. QA11 TaxID=2950605 RepID=UPI0023493578|nr:nuclear transport factor 2 family protein [Sphingomonas sp. QA11]WCM27328.1 nuclear transport factor 2 family protein [Sphingomonas sp. QA11]
MPIQPENSIDYDRLMQANLARVFSERDTGRRIAAIHELYAEDAVLYEPEASATGHIAIDAAVSALLASLPPDFAFTAIGPAIGHHGIGRLRWQAGPANGPVAVAGMDIAQVQGGRIHSLYVFLEPAA